MKALFCALLFVCAAVSGADGLVASAGVAAPAAAPGTPAAVGIIMLRGDAIAAGEQVLLGEIARISGLPAATANKLEQLVAGRAPQPGQKRSFSQDDILSALRKNGVSDTFEFRGERTVSVTATAEMLPAARISDAAIAAVRAYFAADPDLETSFEITSLPTDIPLRSAAVKLEAEAPSGGFRPGFQTIKVRIVKDGRRLEERIVGLRVRVTGSIAVAGERLGPDDILREEMLKTVRKELTANELQSRGAAQKFLGMRAKRAINPDDVLNKTMFALPQVIKRGDAVTIYVKRGGLELATRGEARSDAVQDESVRALVSDSNTEVIGRASGPREITIDDVGQRRE